jgi:hypothetical protein
LSSIPHKQQKPGSNGTAYSLLAGPLLGALVYFILPEIYLNSLGEWIALPDEARMVAAIATLMAV